ncbi:MAG: OmpA family protein [Candidatus Kapabacteria bacterium]|nr:OmpA family protein [Candidatus Kapabacteria bacterium]
MKNLIIALIILLSFNACKTTKLNSGNEVMLGNLKTFHYHKSESIELDSNMKKYLDIVVEVLNDNSNYAFLIEAHSDAASNEETNQERSDKRANIAKAYLITKGIEGKRVLATGKGTNEPYGARSLEESLKVNRRINFKVYLGN